MIVLRNSNGINYDVLGLCAFKGADIEYYKNSWQNYRFGLMQANGNYVVASMVGDTEWGNGYYYQADEMQARKKFDELCKEYSKGE